jgi:hypothetical protein
MKLPAFSPIPEEGLLPVIYRMNCAANSRSQAAYEVCIKDEVQRQRTRSPSGLPLAVSVGINAAVAGTVAYAISGSSRAALGSAALGVGAGLFLGLIGSGASGILVGILARK